MLFKFLIRGEVILLKSNLASLGFSKQKLLAISKFLEPLPWTIEHNIVHGDPANPIKGISAGSSFLVIFTASKT